MRRNDCAAAQDRDVLVIRRALRKLRDLDMYQLAKGDALAAEDALDRIVERHERAAKERLEREWGDRYEQDAKEEAEFERANGRLREKKVMWWKS